MIIIKQPKNISPKHLKQIIELIINGGQVRKDKLKERILRSDLVAYKTQDGKVICTAAIKNPYPSYRAKVFSLAKAKTETVYGKELGYIVTRAGYENKSHCQNLVKVLIEKTKAKSIYATTRLDKMVHILKKYGFCPIGKTYNKNLKLLIYNGNKCYGFR